LKGVGDAIKKATYKILILNGSLDRETRSLSKGAFDATDFIDAISQACKSSFSPSYPESTTSDTGHEVVQEDEYKNYVTHVVHLQGEGTPRVDKTELAGWGIETIRLYGRKMVGNEEAGMYYDDQALGQALEAILGKREGRRDPSRRNTLER
jgi:hypothetical protein